MKVVRFQDWPTRLLAFIESRKKTPFSWGAHDCCLFGADAVAVMTGEDLAAKYRGYSTAKEAAALIADAGGLAKMVESCIADGGGVELPNVRKMQRGDIALMEQGGRDSVGVCVGGTVAFTAPDALTFYPVKDCHRAWRIG